MNQKTIRGQFPSQKMNRSVKFFSAMQRDYIFLLEYDCSVLTYRTRPFSVPSEVAKEHTPDFLVERGEDSLLIDCHYAEHLSSWKVREKSRVLKEWGRPRGIGYQIITDVDLWGDYLLLNVKRLFANSRYAASEEARTQLVRVLEQCESTTLGELQAELRIAISPNISPLPLKMAWEHEIQLEMRTKPISCRTRVQLKR